MRHFAAFAFLVLAFAPVLASEPGQPLDCSDWLFLEPGYSCDEWVSWGCPGLDPEQPPCRPQRVTNLAIDNAGNGYRYRVLRNVVPTPTCGMVDRIELYRYDGHQETVFAYLNSRCGTGTSADLVEVPDADGAYVVFDDKNGRLLVWLKSLCIGSMPPCQYTSGWWVAAITGFATTFEILQTYAPSDFSFRVPYMPEGFQSADAFDSYHGDLATLPDWSQAQPLQCDFPPTPPSVGEYLTVADTLPDPAPGQGRYYVTAVHHAGETRFGRQDIGGTLAGRNPATLPVCSQ